MLKFWLQYPLFEEASGNADGGGSGESEGAEGADETSSEEGEDAETSEEEEELSEEEVKNAKGLFKMLKDPNTRDIVLRTMAQKAGVLGDNAPSTRIEEKKAIRDVADVLKDSLGPEYFALFGDKLSKGLKELFAQEREENSKNVESLNRQQLENETDRAFDRLDRETKGESKKFRQSMTVLADKIHKADGVSVYEYLNILYTAASGDKARSSANKQIADKINRNRSDVGDRVHQLTAGANGGKGGNQPQQPKGLKNIVEAAINGLAGGSNKRK